jgi:hypothetical protein
LRFTVPFGAFKHRRYLEYPIVSVQDASDDLNQCYGVSGRCGGNLPSKSAVWQAVQTSAKGHLMPASCLSPRCVPRLPSPLRQCSPGVNTQAWQGTTGERTALPAGLAKVLIIQAVCQSSSMCRRIPRGLSTASSLANSRVRSRCAGFLKK